MQILFENYSIPNPRETFFIIVRFARPSSDIYQQLPQGILYYIHCSMVPSQFKLGESKLINEEDTNGYTPLLVAFKKLVLKCNGSDQYKVCGGLSLMMSSSLICKGLFI